MTQLIYNLSTETRFNYGEGAQGEHQLYVSFEFISPITNISTSCSFLMLELINSKKREFYEMGEQIMTSKAQVLEYVANEMARVIRYQLEASGGINWEQVAKEKFDKALELHYDFNVYIDLNKTYQTGTN